MNHIIAGDPAPTNPTAAAGAVRILSGAGLTPETAGMLARRIVSAARREVLAEAIEAARSERLTDNTGTDVDNAYNQAVTDVIDALLALAVDGAR